MVVVTVLLAALLVYPNIPQSPPTANLFIEAHNFTQNETASGNGTASGSETTSGNEAASGGYLIEASSGPGGSISPTGGISVLAGSNATFNITPAANYKVLDVQVDGASAGPVSTYTFNNVSSNHSIQASFTVDFAVINNNTVVPKENFTVNATVLGAAFMRNTWENDSWVEGHWEGHGRNQHWVEGYWEGHWESVPFPITCRLKIGSYISDPWGNYTNVSDGNLNDGKNPRFWGSNTYFKAGTPVTVEACSWEYNNPKQILTVNTSTNSPNLKVLKNGDPVPDIPGFQGQDSIEDFVTDYIENGSIKLKENEAIYLFELGNTNLNSVGADFQDLVILISVNGADTPQSATVSQDMVYPNETSNDIPNEASDETQNKNSNDTPHETVLKLVIEHRGGDAINFQSFNETKVILQKGDDQCYLNFTELGVFKNGDRATLIPKEYGTDEQLSFSQGDQLVIRIVDVSSKSLIYSGSITVK
jgi:hypothetical protein